LLAFSYRDDARATVPSHATEEVKFDARGNLLPNLNPSAVALTHPAWMLSIEWRGSWDFRNRVQFAVKFVPASTGAIGEIGEE
jgi:hypothetical protein